MAVLDLQPGEVMAQAAVPKNSDGDRCQVMAGTHKGKSGTVRDINTSKTGQVTITVMQDDGERFKTLAKNVAKIRI
jgi:ribosomal protein S4E